MKFLILVSLVATGTCWSWDSSSESGFSPSHTWFSSGTQYEYKYESQVMTGLPSFSRQYSGIKVISNIKITFTSATSCVLQMDEVKVLSLNKEITDENYLPPFKQISINEFSPLPSDESSRVIKKLLLPIRFSYQDGLVHRLEITDEETNWSVDMKRSILSMLQVKLQADDFRVTEKLSYNDLKKENVSSFDVLESGLDGTCYSTLHVHANRDVSELYKVIKTRDISKCLKINVIDKNVYPQRQTNCDCRNNMNGGLKSESNCVCQPVTDMWNSSRAEYNKATTDYDLISQDGVNFLIRKAVQSVENRVESPESPNKFMTTISNQTLVMTNERRQPQNLLDSSLSWKTISEPWKLRVLMKHEESLMMTPRELMDTIEKLWTEIVTISTQPERFNDHLTVFVQLVEKVQLCNTEQLSLLFNKIRQVTRNQHSHKQWQVYVDALAAANTTETNIFLLSKIVSGDIGNAEAFGIFLQWTAEKVPTTHILDYMMTEVLPKLKRTESKKVVYQHALLCFSSMIRRYIHSEEVKMSQCILPVDKEFHRHNINSCSKYEKVVVASLTTARTNEEKILALKAAANLGSMLTLPMLQKFLDHSEPTAIRVHAIYAFTNLGFQNQLKITQTLLPIMLHQQEDTELRVAAFLMLMKSDPTTVLSQLQKTLNIIKDLEFKTFVVNRLKNMLQDNEPLCQNRQMRIRQLLKSVRAFQWSQETIDFQVKYGIKNVEGTGDVFKMISIANYSTNYPRSVSAQVYTEKNNVVNHLFEIGYRAEGLENLRALKPSVSRESPRDLRNLGRMHNRLSSDKSESASITLYYKFLGQQMSFAHLDERAIMMLLRMMEMNNGVMEIPVAIFRTSFMTPREINFLQPSGFWLKNSQFRSTLIDFEGVIRVEMSAPDFTPIMSLKTSKPIRLEMSQATLQQVNFGFTRTGQKSQVLSRTYANAKQTNILYNMKQNVFEIKYTNPSPQLYSRVEMLASTRTFVLPARLPKIIATQTVASKELKVDESQRKQISIDLPSMKSIELKGKIEGEINIPEWFTFTRDRMHIIPTYISIYKQHLVMDVQPVDSADREVVFTVGGQYFVPSVADIERMSNSKKEEESRGIFSFMWNMDSERQESKFNEDMKMSQSPSLWSLAHSYGMSFASISNGRTLNMTANLTSFYEHDHPTSKSVLTIVRPPIPSQEKENYQIVDDITKTVNPGTNEIVMSHNIKWGPQSAPKTHTITLTSTSIPSFKDNICHSETTYGCKDQYGIVYPVWYSNSLHVEYENTRIPELVKESMKYWLLNLAESVYVAPTNEASRASQSMDLNMLVRPENNKVDIIFRDSQFVTNFTKLYCPIASQVTNTRHHYPSGDNVAFTEAGYLPVHHHQFMKVKDVCVFETPRFYAFDRKECQMPKSDCEVELVGKCDHSVPDNMKVSAVQSSHMSAPKMVKVLLENQMIKMDVREEPSGQKIIVSVNGVTQDMEKEEQVIVKENDKTIAVIKCYNGQCEILSESHGLYMKLNMERLSLALDSMKSNYVCGLCAKHPALPSEPSKDSCKTIFKQNVISGDQCSIEESLLINAFENESCGLVKRWRHVTTMEERNGHLMHCVSVEQKPICRNSCHKLRQRHMENVDVKCVTEEQARTIGVSPTTEGGESIIENPKVVDEMKSQGVARKANIQIYDRCQ